MRELAGVATARAANATGAGSAVAWVQAPSVPVLPTGEKETELTGARLFPAPPTAYTTRAGAAPRGAAPGAGRGAGRRWPRGGRGGRGGVWRRGPRRGRVDRGGDWSCPRRRRSWR